MALYLMATFQSQHSERRFFGARLARLLTRSGEERELSSYVVLALLLAIVAVGLYFEFRRPALDSSGVAKSFFFNDPWTTALWLVILPLTAVLAVRAIVVRPSLIRSDYAIFLFVAFNLLSLAWAPHDARAASLHWLAYIGVGLGLYFVAREYSVTRSRALLLAAGMLSFLVLFASINLLAWKWTPLSSAPSQLDGRGSRLMGATDSPASLSVTVAFLMIFCLLGLSRDSPRWLRRLAFVGGLLGAGVVVFGNTRSAIIGLGLALIAALWIERRWSWLAGLGVISVIAILSPLSDRFLTGWRTLFSGANPNTVPGLINGVFRLQLWSEAVKILWHPWTPFVGDGIGTTVVSLPAIYHTHSEVLQVWLETGTVGLGLGVWIYVSLVRRMLTTHETFGGVARVASLIGVCAVALAIPNFIWFVVLNSQVGWLLMIACAISVSAADWGPEPDDSREPVNEHPAMIGAVREFWDSAPCGSDLSSATDHAYFNETAAARYQLEPHIKPIAQFERFRDRDVLEIGCGIGADGASFASAGARYSGVDLSPASVALTQARFDTLGLAGTIQAADAESLPFEDSSFDHVYSFGVIHHSPNTAAIVDEMHRVLRPGGTFCVMVYNKSSINYYIEIMGLRRALRWVLVPSWSPASLSKIGLPRAKLEGHRAALRRNMTHDQWVSMNTDGPDCPLAKVYSASHVQRLFHQFSDVRTEVRFFNRAHWPGIGRLLPANWLGNRWGWHRIVYGRKA